MQRAGSERTSRSPGSVATVTSTVQQHLPGPHLRFLCVSPDQYRKFYARRAKGPRGRRGSITGGVVVPPLHSRQESAPAEMSKQERAAGASPRDVLDGADDDADPVDVSAVNAICAAGAVARDIRRRKAAEQRELDWDKEFDEAKESGDVGESTKPGGDGRGEPSDDSEDIDSDGPENEWMPDAMRDIRASLGSADMSRYCGAVASQVASHGNGSSARENQGESGGSAIGAAKPDRSSIGRSPSTRLHQSIHESRKDSVWLKRGSMAKAAEAVRAATMRARPQQAAKEASFLWERLPLPVLQRVNSVLLELKLAVEIVCTLSDGDARSKVLLNDPDLLAALVSTVTPAPAALLHHPIYAFTVERAVAAMRSLSLEPKCLEPLRRAGAIRALIRVLGMEGPLGQCQHALDRVTGADGSQQYAGLQASRGGSSEGRIDASTGSVPAMYDGSTFDSSRLWAPSMQSLWTLLRVNQAGQQLAVRDGVVQVLSRFVLQQSTRWTFATKILCDLPMSGDVARDRLWEGGLLELLLGLLSQDTWKVQAAQSIALWLGQDVQRIGKALLKPSAVLALEDYFAGPSQLRDAQQRGPRFSAGRGKSDNASQLMTPLRSMLRTYVPLAARLSQSVRFVAAVFARLEVGRDPVYLRALLGMLADLWEAATDKRRFARLHDMEDRLAPVADGRAAARRGRAPLQLIGKAAANLLQQVQGALADK